MPVRCIELRLVPSLPSQERQVVDPVVFTSVTGRPPITRYSRTSRVHVECNHTNQKIWHIRVGSTAKPGMPARRLSLKSILTVQCKSQKSAVVFRSRKALATARKRWYGALAPGCTIVALTSWKRRSFDRTFNAEGSVGDFDPSVVWRELFVAAIGDWACRRLAHRA
jgi:hypothetical protein